LAASARTRTAARQATPLRISDGSVAHGHRWKCPPYAGWRPYQFRNRRKLQPLLTNRLCNPWRLCWAN